MNKSKYKNKKTEIGGILFDSKKEARYYLYLREKLNNGEIQHLELQKKYKLEINGKLICSYVCDFLVTNNDNTEEVIDVKSEATKKLPVYRMKKKLMKAIHNIEIKEV